MSFPISLLQRFFSDYQHLVKFYVAYSGGLDSTVLLHAMHTEKLPIHAIHVNHHLQKECDSWQKHCEAVCKQWGIAISIKHAEIQNIPQKSLEDLARDARYKLLEEMLDSNSAIVTAHHQDDVAETILLQLLRGSGPAGLAAMPEVKKLIRGFHLRPMLRVSRKELLSYANEHGLDWVDDPSNNECDFDRNYLRNEVLPKIIKRWPAAQKTLARSAELQAQTLSCLHELAKIDLRESNTDESNILEISTLQALSDERLSNVLHYWIQSHNLRTPSRKILQQVISDIVRKQEIETSPMQSWKEGEIRRFQNRLYLMEHLSMHDPSQEFRWKINQPLFIESLNRTLLPQELIENNIAVPEGANELIVRFRQGGERLKLVGQTQHRSLKNLLNQAGVPPWERSRIPLLYHGDQLISVLGYWNVDQFCET